jgi:hypothetical protein
MNQDLRLLFLFPALPQSRGVVEQRARLGWVILLLRNLRPGMHPSDSMFSGQFSIFRADLFRHSPIDTAKASLIRFRWFPVTKKEAPFPSGAMGYKADATLISN